MEFERLDDAIRRMFTPSSQARQPTDLEINGFGDALQTAVSPDKSHKNRAPRFRASFTIRISARNSAALVLSCPALEPDPIPQHFSA
jgi:hypothetical protein